MGAKLIDVTAFCDERTRRANIADFPGAWNGLQVQNSGSIRRIGAAVDAGLVPFQMAAERGIDFLIVHHGLFWDSPLPLTEINYTKISSLLKADCALYGSHLPLDLHPEIGNNVLLCHEVGLRPVDAFLEYEGNPVGTIAACDLSRTELAKKLKKRFPGPFRSIEFGSDKIERLAVLTGSGSSAIPELKAAGVDTLITGEAKQNFFNKAQEENLNLYLCGHYETEVFGVQALAREVAERFGLEWEFLETGCPL